MPDKDKAKKWYDGFSFGRMRDIYNPWSILNFLDKRKLGTYWANTSSNSLVARQLQQADADTKEEFERLLQGESFETEIDEEIVFSQLNKKPGAIWSLMLASGYLKVLDVIEPETLPGQKQSRYTLCLTNLEVEIMFENLIREWFAEVESDYNAFIKALLQGDVDAMNDYMNEVAAEIFSSFDSGKRASGISQPEERQYDRELIAKGIPTERIRKYGFAFEGKTVLIGV